MLADNVAETPVGRFWPASRAAPASTAGVEAACLRVFGGIIRIVVGINFAEGRLFGGIERLIGVAAGERERRDRQDDAEPHERFPTHWRRTVEQSFGAGEVGHQVLLP